jgi:glucosyl-dolichyl phosphate glucuronosyltransferase
MMQRPGIRELEEWMSHTDASGKAEVRISAVVCTHNRAEYLRKALASLANQNLPPDQCEVVVVDNASTDNTRAVVEEFTHVPNLRYVFEPVPGLSQARNTGWRSARGEYVAYLDDDAIAAPDWLSCYLDAFEAFGEGAGSVGGRAELIWEAPRPDWLPDQLLTHFSLFHWSDQPVVLGKEQWLSGCNLAYSRRVLERIGGFPTNLGRTGSSLMGNEENYVRRRLDSIGSGSVYDPRIAVRHHVPAQRLSQDWFRRVSFAQGTSEAVLVRTMQQVSALGRFSLVVKRIAWTLPRLALSFVQPGRAARFRRECQVRESLGYILAMLR